MNPGRSLVANTAAGALAALVCFSGLLLAHTGAPVSQQRDESPLKKLSLEELVEIDVTSVSRIPEKRSKVPAAVYVITQEDIRRSGATSIPEALRLVPGVQVARIDSSKWAIGIRGFASRLARAMLVMIDGRVVYSPLFAGTYWEVQDTLLEDVDRIEVILGPGGTLWGANAVNGIINIITKSARETRGTLVSVGGGSEVQGFAGFRYGASAGQNTNYRIYGKLFERDAAFHSDKRYFDDWRMGQTGFRLDRTLARDRTLTVQGDLYKGLIGQRTPITYYSSPFTRIAEDNVKVSGGNVLGRWEGLIGNKSDFRLQTYYDKTNREEPIIREGRDTVDFDFQHHIFPIRRQEFVWGIGYRMTSGDFKSSPMLRLVPNRRTDQLVSGFLQDDIELVPGRLHFIAGTKLEHNGYSGFEVQPSGRLLWTPSAGHTVLVSVAHAVRTPSRVEHDMELTTLFQPTTPTAFLRLTQNKDFQPEKLTAYEVGYRVRPVNSLFVTFSGFFNDYDDLSTSDVLTPFFEREPVPPHIVVPFIFANNLRGHSQGMELNSDWRVTRWWRLNGGYSYLRFNLIKNPGRVGTLPGQGLEGSSPRHQVFLQSSVNLPQGLEFDWNFRFVSEVPSTQRIPSYATSNVRLGWRPVRQLEVSVVGQNLHEAHHAEFAGGVQIERGVYGKMAWSF